MSSALRLTEKGKKNMNKLCMYKEIIHVSRTLHLYLRVFISARTRQPAYSVHGSAPLITARSVLTDSYFLNPTCILRSLISYFSNGKTVSISLPSSQKWSNFFLNKARDSPNIVIRISVFDVFNFNGHESQYGKIDRPTGEVKLRTIYTILWRFHLHTTPLKTVLKTRSREKNESFPTKSLELKSRCHKASKSSAMKSGLSYLSLLPGKVICRGQQETCILNRAIAIEY